MALPLDQVIHGDALTVLKTFPANSIDSLVVDPPAGIFFMNKTFDSDKGGRSAWVKWLADIMGECLRVLKNGSYGLVWSLPRTSHWAGLALELAGFELRDMVSHLYSPNEKVSAFCASLTTEQRDLFTQVLDSQAQESVLLHCFGSGFPKSLSLRGIGRPELGTGLKPAVEQWWLVRKPLSEKSVAENVLRWGTGALNIDASRIGTTDTSYEKNCNRDNVKSHWGGSLGNNEVRANPQGRFPSNLLLSHAQGCTEEACDGSCPVAEMDRQSGKSASQSKGFHGRPPGIPTYGSNDVYNKSVTTLQGGMEYGDQGGASRYFQTFAPFAYAGKASRKDRNEGLEGMPEQFLATMNSGVGNREHERGEPTTYSKNNHPTVKSQNLCKYLISLVNPPGGIVLDCFAGSGSTLVAAASLGFHCIGIELNNTESEPYVEIARKRLAHAQAQYARFHEK